MRLQNPINVAIILAAFQIASVASIVSAQFTIDPNAIRRAIQGSSSSNSSQPSRSPGSSSQRNGSQFNSNNFRVVPNQQRINPQFQTRPGTNPQFQTRPGTNPQLRGPGVNQGIRFNVTPNLQLQINPNQFRPGGPTKIIPPQPGQPQQYRMQSLPNQSGQNNQGNWAGGGNWGGGQNWGGGGQNWNGGQPPQHHNPYPGNTGGSYQDPAQYFNRPQYSNQPIVIRCPAGQAGSCSYELVSQYGNFDYLIAESQYQAFPEDRLWKIKFARGDGTHKTYRLHGGRIYRVQRLPDGLWQVYQEPLATPAQPVQG